ncbi:unnamed protein product [Onchocerca flexuosa]|uniref:YTH domain-containing protein n=1 Tax=Onchocerca flexuosa TaxID=387005 RepID=A0A183H7K1_9BILA|nr:unnamed protein product [Onchocerca flexuosa]
MGAKSNGLNGKKGRGRFVFFKVPEYYPLEVNSALRSNNICTKYSLWQVAYGAAAFPPQSISGAQGTTDPNASVAVAATYQQYDPAALAQYQQKLFHSLPTEQGRK